MSAQTEEAPSSDAAMPPAPRAGEGSGDGAGKPAKTGLPAKIEELLGPAAPYLPDRREALFLLGGGAIGAAVGYGAVKSSTHEVEPVVRDDAEEFSSREAKERLEAGNARYVAGTTIHPDQTVERRDAIAGSQKPFVAVLSCADSRVPPEVIFDQGLGDMFVVRSAGQVVDQAVLGSLQYGVEHVGVPLLLVLGHSSCGAVKATVEALESKAAPSGTAIDALVKAITPAVHEAEEVAGKDGNILSVAIDVNVERIVEQLKASDLIGEAVLLRKTKVLGATYSLKTGEVNWL